MRFDGWLEGRKSARTVAGTRACSRRVSHRPGSSEQGFDVAVGMFRGAGLRPVEGSPGAANQMVLLIDFTRVPEDFTRVLPHFTLEPQRFTHQAGISRDFPRSGTFFPGGTCLFSGKTRVFSARPRWKRTVPCLIGARHGGSARNHSCINREHGCSSGGQGRTARIHGGKPRQHACSAGLTRFAVENQANQGAAQTETRMGHA